jgi:folate-dependent phosphoribosylglycinamide formyltransferase PurN
MNIVFLTSENIHQYYLINEVHKLHPVRKVFLQERIAKPVQLADRVKRLLRPSSVTARVRSFLADILFRRERTLEWNYEKRRFFQNRAPAMDASIPVEFVRSFNDGDAVARVVEEKPDLIIVFGTDILRGAILNTARIAILNIHRAIVPRYRGGGHPFWAFYLGDFENIGTTVHVCVNQLDGGDIVGRGYYALSAYDRIYMLRYHTTMIALGILRRVIPRLIDGTLEYIRQDTDGRTWRAKDLTIWKQLVARWKFRWHVRGLKNAAGNRTSCPAARQGVLPE